MPTNDSSSRDRILAYLQSQGGSISSEEGRGLTQALASAAGYTDLSVLNGMLSRLEREGVIQRDIRGRRTYRIALAGGGSAAAGARRSSGASRRGERAASAPGRTRDKARTAGRPAANRARGATSGSRAGSGASGRGRIGGGPPAQPQKSVAARPAQNGVARNDTGRLADAEEAVRRLGQDVTRLTARLARLEAEVADMDRLVTRVEAASRAQQPPASQPPPVAGRRGLFGRR